MADFSLTKIVYKSLIRKLFPSGFVWSQGADSEMERFVDSTSSEAARLELRALLFLDEMSPLQAFEMLDNWERLLGLPDECTPETEPSISERRLRVLQKLTTGGGQSKEFYRLIADQLGYATDDFAVNNFRDFQVGVSSAGEPLSNSTNANGTRNANGWADAFEVVAPAEFVRYFLVGLNGVGDPLVLAENTTLECVIRKFAPAHASVVFSYTE